MQEDFKTEADKLLAEILEEDEDGNKEPPAEPKEEPAKEATPPVDKTKEYSERLNKDRARIKQETQAELAKAMGFESWDEMLAKKHDDTMLEKGLDPELVKPMIKEFLQQDPDYIAAMEYKKDKEAKEKEIWAQNELLKLNNKFGLGLTSIEDLDENVIKLWNSGIPLDKAYAAEHYVDLEKLAMKKAIVKGNGKEHLINPGTSGNKTDKVKTLTPEELKMFKQINPYASEEEINKYINK